jgi:hypothetical protein
LKSETYLSQRAVAIGLDEIGRQQSVSSGAVSYAGAIGYAALASVSEGWAAGNPGLSNHALAQFAAALPP